MAQKVTVHLIDDIDESEAAETVQFGLDGTHYEIDLNEKNAAKLRKALAPFAEAGRRANGSRLRAKSRASTSNSRVVREWARQAGYTVPDRGRIPQEVQAAYDAVH